MPYNFVTTEERSQLMKKVKSNDTSPETCFRKLLWESGIRYRKHDKKLPGRPDITIYKYKIAIFVDGEFWHGFEWKKKKERIKSNRDYWIPKIERNIERDKKNNYLLEQDGWAIVRFWEAEIKKYPQNCLEKILTLMEQRQRHE